MGRGGPSLDAIAEGRLAVEPQRRPGWPKGLPCLRCGRRRRALSPADRLHVSCRVAAAADDVGAIAEGRLTRPRAVGG